MTVFHYYPLSTLVLQQLPPPTTRTSSLQLKPTFAHSDLRDGGLSRGVDRGAAQPQGAVSVRPVLATAGLPLQPGALVAAAAGVPRQAAASVAASRSPGTGPQMARCAARSRRERSPDHAQQAEEQHHQHRHGGALTEHVKKFSLPKCQMVNHMSRMEVLTLVPPFPKKFFSQSLVRRVP